MRVEEIVKRETAIHFNLTRREIEGRYQARRIARPRQLAMALCRHYGRSSTIEIGKRFGGRDHSTVIHATKVVSARCADPDFISQVAHICWLAELEIAARRRAVLNQQIAKPSGPIALLAPPPKMSAWRRRYGAHLGPIA